MEKRIDLILHAARGGEENMTLDRAALARAEEGHASVRIYSWREPTVSLGKRQSPEDVADLFPGLPTVARPTGGGAVLHGFDLTVTLAVPLITLEVGVKEVRETYRRLTRDLSAALWNSGIRCKLAEDRATAEDRDCFASVGRMDLVDRKGRKVAGCALATTRTAALLQASIPLPLPPSVDTGSPAWRAPTNPPWDVLHFPHSLAAGLRYDGWTVHLSELDPALDGITRALAVLHQIVDREELNAMPDHDFEEEYDHLSRKFVDNELDTNEIRYLSPETVEGIRDRMRGFEANPFPDPLTFCPEEIPSRS